MGQILFRAFDWVFFFRHRNARSADRVEAIVENQKHVGPGVYAALSAIDSKASALLTHISLIVAALSVLSAAPGLASGEKILIFLEIGAYLVVATMCLRCIRLLQPVSSTDIDELKMETVKRADVYVIASQLALFLTVILVLFMSCKAIASVVCGLLAR